MRILFSFDRTFCLLFIKWWSLCLPKVVIRIDIDDIGNKEDILRVVLIDKECGNLEIVVESLPEILTKRSQTFYRPINFYPVTNAMGEGISSRSGILRIG